jgi:hypothetical protein
MTVAEGAAASEGGPYNREKIKRPSIDAGANPKASRLWTRTEGRAAEALTPVDWAWPVRQQKA